MRSALRALLCKIAVFAALVLVLMAPGFARAQELGGTEQAMIDAPPDSPHVGDKVEIPAVPSSFATKSFGWMTVKYDLAAAPRLEPVFHEAEEVREQVSVALGARVLERVEVRVVRTTEEMKALAPIGVPPPAYAIAVAYPSLHLVLLSLAPPRVQAETPDLMESFRHEMSHVALFDAAEGNHIPHWFDEGIAMWVAGETLKHDMAMAQASFSKSLLPLSDLDRRFPTDSERAAVAYAESADFIRYLLKGSDAARFRSVLERVRQGTAFYRALSDSYGSDFRKLEFQWREDVAKRYTFYPFLGGGSILWMLVIGMMALAWVKRKKNAKVILSRWEREEALEAAARRALESGEEPTSVLVAARSGDLPRIEHDGEWYTLH